MAGIPFAEQRLLHGGKQLPDSRTLSALDIESGSSLQLVLSLRGGAPKKKGGDKGKKGKGKDKVQPPPPPPHPPPHTPHHPTPPHRRLPPQPPPRHPACHP